MAGCVGSRREHGYASGDSKAALRTRLSPIDARNCIRARDLVDVIETSAAPRDVRAKRCRADDLHLVFVAEKEVA